MRCPKNVLLSFCSLALAGTFMAVGCGRSSSSSFQEDGGQNSKSSLPAQTVQLSAQSLERAVFLRWSQTLGEREMMHLSYSTDPFCETLVENPALCANGGQIVGLTENELTLTVQDHGLKPDQPYFFVAHALNQKHTSAMQGAQAYTLKPNGAVAALFEDTVRGVTYVGGHYDAFGVVTGGGVTVDADSGAPVGALPTIVGSVLTTISDGNGGWYIGGHFVSVGGKPRQNIAHLNAQGAVTSFGAEVEINASVNSLVMVGETLYVAGGFTCIENQGRQGLASFKNGQLTDWAPSVANGMHTGNITQMVAAGSMLYVVGTFDHIDGQHLTNIAALNTAKNNEVLKWNAAISNNGAAPIINTIALSQDALYVGGNFNTVGTVSGPIFTGLARFVHAASESPQLDENWTPTLTSSFSPAVIRQLTATPQTLFVLGYFTDIKDDFQNKISGFSGLSSFDLKVPNGSLLRTCWQPQIDGGGTSVNALAAVLKDEEEVVFLGGIFNSINNKSFSGVAAIKADGNTVNWKPQISHLNESPAVIALAVQNDTVFLGGNFTQLDTMPRSSLASFNTATEILTAWNPHMTLADNTTPGSVNALASDGHILVVGGNFASVGAEENISRNSLASFDLNKKNALTSWNASVSNHENRGTVYTILWQGTDTSMTPSDGLYIGGLFTTASDGNDAAASSAVAKFNLAPSEHPTINPLWTTPASTTGTVYALTLAKDRASLYAGGDFSVGVANPENHLVSLVVDGAEGGGGTSRQANFGINGAVRALLLSDNNLYVGGLFESITVGTELVDVRYLTAFYLNSDSTLAPIWSAWDPVLNSDGQASVLTLGYASNILYVGGYFSAVAEHIGDNEISRTNLTAFEMIDGQGKIDNGWAPVAFGGAVSAMRLGEHGVNVGGYFALVNGAACFYLCQIAARATN